MDYTFYEMGKYDVPANVDFVLKQTNNTKLSFIGHSFGTSQMFSALAFNHGNIKDKVDVFLAMAPVTRTDTTNPLFLQIVANINFLQWTLYKLFIYEFFGPDQQQLIQSFCKFKWMSESFCATEIDLLEVRHMRFEPERVSPQEQTIQNSISVKSMIHMMQINGKGFLMFDYYNQNEDRNMLEYGQSTPPHIPIETIKEPNIILYVGTKDDISTLHDAKWLNDEVESISELKTFDCKHSDFHFFNDQSFFDGIIQRLDSNNGVREKRQAMGLDI